MIIIDALVPSQPLTTLPTELDAALRGRARVVRERIEQAPEAARQQAAEALARAVVSWATGAVTAVNAEFSSATKVGLVLSSARPGLKRIAFVFTDRLDPRRRLECFLTTKPQAGELALLGEQLGRITELARVGLQDADAAGVLLAAAERLLLETAQSFGGGAA
jgi:hypothetical protein